MRPLTADAQFSGGAGSYTEAQLTERLLADGAAIGTRFDILDDHLNIVNSLGTVQAISDVTVSIDTSRDVVGSLGMSMLPNTPLNLPFKYRVKPWFRVQMLDGGIAEWPMGVYVWNIPNRRDVGTPQEEWDVTLGDQTNILQLAGPGPAGFVAPKGAAITEIVQQILVSELGFTDMSGIQHSGAVLTATLHWGMTSRTAATAAKDYTAQMRVYNLQMSHYTQQIALWHRLKSMYDHMKHADKSEYAHEMKGYNAVMAQRKAIAAAAKAHHRKVHLPPAPKHPSMPKRAAMPKAPHKPKKPKKPARFAGTMGTTWLEILTELHTRAGWNAPWFDLSGRYRATPQPDYTTSSSVKLYKDGSNGIMVRPIETQEDIGHLCNRVVARSATNAGYYNIATADLNTIIPGHPLSQQSIGFYIDVAVEDTISTDITGLTATAVAELHRRVARYQEVDVETLAWPVHEVFDFIGVQVTTDIELASEVVCLEQGWDMNLRTGKMSHTLQRIQ